MPSAKHNLSVSLDPCAVESRAASGKVASLVTVRISRFYCQWEWDVANMLQKENGERRAKYMTRPRQLVTMEKKTRTETTESPEQVIHHDRANHKSSGCDWWWIQSQQVLGRCHAINGELKKENREEDTDGRAWSVCCNCEGDADSSSKDTGGPTSPLESILFSP
jgi:hypothetical protein